MDRNAVHFVDGAVKAAGRVKRVVDGAMVDAEKLKNNTIPALTKNCLIVETGEPANQLVPAQAYVNTITHFLRTTMGECLAAQQGAKNMIDAEKLKVPPQLLKGQTGQVLMGAQQLLAGLMSLNSENGRLAGILLPRAEKLVNN